MSEISLPDDLNKWPPENDLGNVEYKSRLSKMMDVQKFHRLVTQMKWRLDEGADMFGVYETIYIIGLHDEGHIANLTKEEMKESMDVIEEIIGICEATITRMTFINNGNGRIVIVYIKSNSQTEKHFPVFSRFGFENDINDTLSSDCDDIIDD